MCRLPKYVHALMDSVIEKFGFYQSEPTLEQARTGLEREREIWRRFQEDRIQFWGDFQDGRSMDLPLNPFANKALQLISEEIDPSGKIAVDLGCGLSSTPYHLLRAGWTVYAVDSSQKVLDLLKEKITELNTNWIDDQKLILVNSSIEEYQFPHQVSLILATESLPYCDPSKIESVFFRARDALSSGGLFAYNLFPHVGLTIDLALRGMMGAWLANKDIITCLMKSICFDHIEIVDGRSPLGLASQIHVFARNGLEKIE